MEESEQPSSFWPGIEQFKGPQWEECHFEPVFPTEDSFPDWRFSVFTYESRGGPLVCEFHLHLSLDHGLQAYIARHPKWRLNMKPLILFMIQEVLSGLKIVEAEFGVEEEIHCGFYDPERGKCEGYYVTRKLVDQEGVTWIHVSNYANTHVKDTLENFYTNHPELAPSPEEIAKGKNLFYANRTRNASEEDNKKEVARLHRKRGDSSVSIFLDESGDTGFRESGFYVSAAVFMPTHETNRLRAALAQVLELCWFRQVAPIELHFSKMAPKKQERVSRLISRIIRRLNCRAVVYITPKLSFLRRLSRSEAEFRRGKDYPIQINWGELLLQDKTAAANWLLAYLLDETVSHIVIENLEEMREVTVAHDEKRFPWQNKAIERGAEIARETIKSYVFEMFGDDEVPPIHFGSHHSETEPCLWLADWMGWEIQRFLKSGILSPELISVLPMTTCLMIDGQGVKSSTNLQTQERLHSFPDYPRNISPPDSKQESHSRR